MHWRVRALWRRLRGTLSAPQDDAAMSEELRFHLDMATQRNVARGMTLDAARRDAIVRFGGVDRTRELAWDVQRSRHLENAWRDARHALRLLRRTPGFALAALLTLGLGIGATTAILSVIDAVLLRPLPYTDPAELVLYWPEDYATYRASSENARTLRTSGAYTYATANVSGGAQPARVWTLAVTSSLLPTLGVTPLLGRNFTADDDVPNAPRRVLLRHGFWQTQFGGDASLVGRTIQVNGAAHEVIGVLPPELEFPPPVRQADGSMPRTPDVWTGVGWLSDLYERGGIRGIARLSTGATATSAAAELSALAQAALPQTTPRAGLQLAPASESVIAPLRPAVYAFTAGVLLVLLVSCANLGSLLLARIVGRQRELALRLSLGAARGRIMRQILTESAVLAAGGTVAGIALAQLLLRVLLLLAPPELARVQNATLSLRVLAGALLLAVLTTLLTGLLPAWRAMQRDARATLNPARGSTGDRNTGRMHAALVSCEIAFAVILLIGGGLLLRSFASLSSVNPGFDSRGLVTADVFLTMDRYREQTAVLDFVDRLEQRLAAQHHVRSVSGIDRLPYGPSVSGIGFQIVGRPETETDVPRALNTAARAGYFRTMGIPLVQGREFTAADGVDAPRVVVIARTLAERYWPNASPLGQRIVVWGVEREIVGVAGDVRHLGPLTPADPLIYLPHTQDIVIRRMMTIVLRTDAPEQALASLRAEIRALDAELPISNLRSFGMLRTERTASQRFNALLVSTFATLATILAAVGIYGVSSFVVAQRTREIAVRMALGATHNMVLLAFLRRAMRAVAAGAVAGIALALPLTRLLRSMLFGVAPTDIVTYAAVMVLVATIGLFAAGLPARRAARVHPSVALIGD